MEPEREYRCKVASVKEEAPGVRSIFLECVEKKLDFIAGQYVTIRLPGVFPPEGKAYSIASAPYEPQLRIAVKTLGNFSTAINSLTIGGTVVTSAPYGFFYPELGATTPIVVVAGGIGITPGMSIIKDQLIQSLPRQTHLLYSNKTESDIVFRSELESLATNHSTFRLQHFLTRQAILPAGAVAGRLDGARILEQTAYLADPEYFICGSIPFVRELYKSLKLLGVPLSRLYTEGFF